MAISSMIFIDGQRRPLSGIRRYLRRHATLGITVFSTPFDEGAVELYKAAGWASIQNCFVWNTDLPLIRYVAKAVKLTVMLTGMASEETIAEKLDLRGIMNVKMRLTAQGPRVFEMSPCFSSTVLLRHRLGFTEVIWALQEFYGEKINFPEIALGQVMVRTQDAVVL